MAGALTTRAGNRVLSISFEADIAELSAALPDFAHNRIPSITRNALNDTVEDARFAEGDKIRGVFDRPTPLTQKSALFRKATKEHLVAEVFIRDEASGGTAPAKYLQPQVEGGQRMPKRFELALRAIGAMRPDEYALPAIGYQRNAYGNLPGSLLVRILSQLRAAEMTAGYMANETGRSRKRNRKRVPARYFVPTGYRQEKGISRLPRGVYERKGNRIRAVLMFVSRPTYRKRYDFGQAAKAKAERVFPQYWQRHFYAELAKHTGRRMTRPQLG